MASAALAAVALLAMGAPARAETLLDTTVSALRSADRSCVERDLSALGAVDAKSTTAPSTGLVQARLEGPDSADWDLAVLDATTGTTVAGSAYSGSTEVAEGYALNGEPLLVQACLRSGTGTAELTVDFTPIDVSGNPGKVSLVKVVTPTRADKERLHELGLDLTEHGGTDFVSVVTYGADDRRTLEEAGFRYVVDVPDLVEQSARDRAADVDFSRSVSASSLPSGRTTYRRLFDYGDEMKQLAEENPDIVEPITLPFETYEGRPVEGIEITTDPEARDGKPVFLQMGVHHAREWPSGEHAMEWAHELIDGYNDGNQRVVDLVESTRTIVVPVVNPDGFNISRETGELMGAGNGRDADSYSELLVQLAAYGHEYWRKNCRLVTDSDAGSCVQPGDGLFSPGVDPNRNYGGFWGGPGASSLQIEQDYRGPGPFSEPETENVQELVSNHQVTTLITNHTFSNLVLRPPGVAGEPDAPDEPLYRQLGAAMAAENGYANLKGYQLYDTTGTTEDWTYWSTGGLGFTFEISCEERFEGTEECDYGNFHGPYEDAVVAEYEGTTEFADANGDGAGNRAAYFTAQESTANAARHSVIAGKAPAGAVLRLQKTFQTQTWKGEHGSFEDHLDTTLEVPASGEFEWHVNPSTRPVVAQERGREATGEPSPPESFQGAPNDSAQPCADYDTTDEACWNDHAFTVPGGEGIDNARATVRIDWATPASDWDMKVFRDSDGDGSSAGEKEEVAASGQGATNFEEASFAEPVLQPGEQYVVRVINYAAVEPYDGTVTYEGPEDFKPSETESWALTCESPSGDVKTSQQVTVDRGERERLNLRGCNRSGKGGAKAR